ncbi:AdoMet-dependent rRNA methyltransferase spb1 [Modicella reniformis]|uniref:AdoMet-dependent rRNA methyltransferase spb1 n=1 Tax=Modicella reniformis TaxID=1440133 RepID=A0A9P6MEU4_9FUNG|nr:AdoMet-dependent rRNA methyltransferase spb1 [Modicella reniformis]
MDFDEEILYRNKYGKTLKRKATEAALEDQDVHDDDIEMVPVNKESEDDEIREGEVVEEDSRKRKQINDRLSIKTQSELIDEGFTKQAFADKDGLLVWFLEDEKKHNVPHLPITWEAVQVIKDRMRTMNARPIKKLSEARVRNKYKAVRRPPRIQKRADAINETEDISEK